MPFRELRRRPAGESLRLKLETLDDKLSQWIMYLLALPIVIGVVVAINRPPSITFLAILFSLSIAWSAGFGLTHYRLLRERANAIQMIPVRTRERGPTKELRIRRLQVQVLPDAPFTKVKKVHIPCITK
jgi:hypothetical protein